MKLSLREKICFLVNNDIVVPSDAIIFLESVEGDFYFRADEVIRLYDSQKLSDTIVASGGLQSLQFGNLCPCDEFMGYISSKCVVPFHGVIKENRSTNTREQAVNVMKIAQRNKWSSIILVGSHYHQVRAFLTFLRAMKEMNLLIKIYNSSAKNFSWFDKGTAGKTYEQLLGDEFVRIEKYQTLGHVVSFDEAVEYFKWRDSND